MPIVRKCRICEGALYPTPLLTYKNMPSRAQHLPGSGKLKNDEGIDLRVCQCSSCGLVQLDGDPVPYYREVIRTAAVSEEMMAFRKKQFSEWIDQNALHNKKALELGCGGGEFLELLSNASEDATNFNS